MNDTVLQIVIYVVIFTISVGIFSALHYFSEKEITKLEKEREEFYKNFIKNFPPQQINELRKTLYAINAFRDKLPNGNSKKSIYNYFLERLDKDFDSNGNMNY